MAALNAPVSIKPLLRLLDDNAKYSELMWSIIHTIESIDDESYVREILGALPELYGQAPQYAFRLLVRILESDTTCGELVRRLGGQPSQTKESVGQIAARIAEQHDLDAKVKTVIAASA